MKQFLSLLCVLFTVGVYAQCNTGCTVSFTSNANISATANNQVICITGGTNYSFTSNFSNVELRICAPGVTLSNITINGTNNVVQTYGANTVIDDLLVEQRTFELVSHSTGTILRSASLNYETRFIVDDDAEMSILSNLNPGEKVFFELGEDAILNTQGVTSNLGGELSVGIDAVFNADGNLFLQNDGYLFNAGDINVSGDLTIQGGDNTMENSCGESNIIIGGTFIVNSGAITNNGLLSAQNIIINSGGPIRMIKGSILEARNSLLNLDEPNIFVGDGIADGECATFKIGTYGSWNVPLSASNKIHYCGPTAPSAALLGAAVPSCSSCESTPDLCVPVCTSPQNVTVTGTASICEGESTTLTAIADGLVLDESYRYSWYKNLITPDSLISESIDVRTLTVSEEGDYYVVIANTINEDDCSGQNNAVFNVTVNPLPGTPTITGTDQVCEKATPINYTVQSPVSGSSYQWTVPTGASILNGQGSSSINVNFNNATSGEKTIAVKEITSNGCKLSDSTTYPITITPLPSTTSITGLTPICANTKNVTYTAVPTNAKSTYQWSVPSGVTLVSGQGTSSITVDIGASGTRTLSVIETDSNSCTALNAYESIVAVNSLPASVAMAGPSTVCANTSATYSVTGSLSYNWSVNGATASSTSGNSINVDFGTNDALVKVIATNTNGCNAIDSTQKAVTVNQRPVTSPIVSTFDTVCEGTVSATFSVTNTTGSSYQWTTTKGSITQGQSTNKITVNFVNETPGIGSVTVVETNNNTCSNLTPLSFEYEVFDRPSTPNISGDGKPLCEEENVVYSVTNTSGSSYNWVVPTDATIVSGQGTSSIVVNFGNSETPDVQVTETNAASCSGQTLSFPVELQGCGLEAIINANSTVCQGSNMTFTDASSGSIDSWSWNFGAGASPASASTKGPHQVTYNTPGTKQIILTTTSGLAVDKDTLELTVYASPTLTANKISGPTELCSFTEDVLYTANGFAGSTYNWSVSGASLASSSGNEARVDFASTNATVNVVETTSDNCASATISLPVTVNSRPAKPTLTGPNVACENSTETYSITGSFDYTWVVSNAVPSSTSGNTIDVDFGTTDAIVKVIATNNKNCSSIDSTIRNVKINTRPTTSPIVSAFDTVCEANTSATFSVTNTSGSYYVWTTDKGTITSGQTTNKITVDFTSESAGTGTINVTEFNSNSCSNLSPLTFDFEVFDRPTTSGITGDDKPLCSETSKVYSVSGNPGSTYNWSVPNGATIVSGQGTSSITVDFGTSNGPSIKVTETNAAKCIGQSKTFPVTLQGCGLQALIDADTVVCQGSVMEFVDASSGNVDSWSWRFGSGASPSTATGRGPHNVTYSSDGVKQVILTATSGLATSRDTLQITVNTKPTIKLSDITGPREVCALTENVDYEANGFPGSSYSWSVTGGATLTNSNGNQATVLFLNTDATVKVVETTADNCASASIDIPVTVNQRPVLPVISGLNEVCAQSTHTYTMDANLDYEWEVSGGGSPSDTLGKSIDINFDSTNVQIKVYATNAENCVTISPANFNVKVNPLPKTSPIVSVFDTVCEANTSAIFRVPRTNGSSYSWSTTKGVIVSGQGSNRIEVDFTGVAAGSGNVTLVETNNLACSNIVPLRYDYEVFDRPVTDPISGNGLPICESDSIKYSVTATPGSVYNWTVPNDAVIISGQGTPEILVDFGSSETPDIQVTETNQATCSGDTLSFPVVLQGCGLMSEISADTVVCEGTSITFSDASSGNIDSWMWDFGTDATPASANTSGPHAVVYNTSGRKEVILTTTSGLASSTDTLFVNVNQSPVLTGDSIIGPREICAFTEREVYTVNGFVGSTYSWSVENANLISASDTEATVSFLGENAIVKVVETTVDQCASNSIELPVTIKALPDTLSITGDNSICAADKQVFSVTNKTGYTYDWVVEPAVPFNGQGSSSIDVTFTKDTIYNVEVVATTTDQCTTPDGVVAKFTSEVHPLPLPSTIEGPDLVCENTLHIYSTTGDPNSTYEWKTTFTDDTIITENNTLRARILFGKAASGQIIAIEKSEYGCVTVDTAKLDMRVRRVPGSPTIISESFCITATGDTIINDVATSGKEFCNDQPATFETTFKPDVTYNWYPEDIIVEGNTTNKIKVKIPEQTFRLRLVETDASGCDSRETNIAISPKAYMDVDSIRRVPNTSIFEEGETFYGQFTEIGAYKVCDSKDSRNHWHFETNLSEGTAIFNWSLTNKDSIEFKIDRDITPIDTVWTVVGSDTIVTVKNDKVDVRFHNPGDYDLNILLKNQYCKCDVKTVSTDVSVLQSTIVDYSIDNPYSCITDSLIFDLITNNEVVTADTIDFSWEYTTLVDRSDLVRDALKDSVYTRSNSETDKFYSDGKYVYNLFDNGIIASYTVKDIYHFDSLAYQVNPRFCVNAFESTLADEIKLNAIDQPGGEIGASVNGTEFNDQIVVDYDANGLTLEDLKDRLGYVYPPNSEIEYQWAWKDQNDSLTSFNIDNPTNESVKPRLPRQDEVEFYLITDNNYCKDTTSFRVYIDYIPWAPNIFSPNNDGSHDQWQVHNIDRYPNAQITIWNRWGSIVYDPGRGNIQPWNGMKNGKSIQVGTYYYVVDLGVPGEAPLSGDVNVIR